MPLKNKALLAWALALVMMTIGFITMCFVANNYRNAARTTVRCSNCAELQIENDRLYNELTNAYLTQLEAK
jgi:hypothetical protein